MALGNVVARLLVRLGIDKREFDAGARDADQAAKGLRDSLGGVTGSADLLTGALKTAGAMGLAYMAKEAMSATWELGKAGAEALRTEASFDRLAARIGETGDALLEALAQAADGTVSDMVLMQDTAGLLASGIQTSSEEIVLAMEIAQLKAQQFGLSTSEAYSRMLAGARKFSVEMLDEIGINIKAESAYKRKAATLGVATDALTDAQRAESLWQAILEDGRQEIEEYGGAIEDHASKFEQAEAAWDNAATALKESLAPAVADAAGAVSLLIESIAGLESGPLNIITQVVEGFSQMTASIAGWSAAAAGKISIEDAINLDVEAARIQAEEGTAAMLEYVQASIEAGGQTADAWAQSAQVRVNALQQEVDMMLEARAAGAEVYQSHIDMAQAELEAAKAELQLAEATQKTANAAAESVPPWEQHVAALDKVTTAARTAAYTEAELANIAWWANNIVRKGGADIYEYRRGLLVEQDQVNPLEQIITLNAQIPSLLQANERAARSMADTWESSWSSMRGAVESALQSTSVTALDMEQTAAGTYVDKWDEDARRLDAVVQGGFAELQAHPDWVELLQIPPEVLSGTEMQLKSWAETTSDQVRNLMRPDLLYDNLDEMADVVEQYIRDQQAREVTINMVIGELEARGFDEGIARQQVEQMFGMEAMEVTASVGLNPDQMAGLSMELDTALKLDTPRQVPVMLAVPEEEAAAMAGGLGLADDEDTEGITMRGEDLAANLLEGYRDAIEQTEPIGDFARHAIQDIGKQHDILSNAGRQAWRPIWESMREAIQTTPILSEIALAVSPYVARILQQHGVF